ncbi:hypothetical protein DID78_06020, partial [Candidatus Marinamargulisbacteria bacterium SCGC AG-343-D04]
MKNEHECTLEIKNYACSTIIGLYEHEQKKEQNLTISLTTSYLIDEHILNDDINLVVDYDKLTTYINTFSKNHSHKLLESFAFSLHKELLNRFSLH